MVGQGVEASILPRRQGKASSAGKGWEDGAVHGREYTGPQDGHSEGYNGLQLRALSEHLHDSDFWKAHATARKWEDANAWRFHWQPLHRPPRGTPTAKEDSVVSLQLYDVERK
jgi:hypothetical protein